MWLVITSEAGTRLDEEGTNDGLPGGRTHWGRALWQEGQGRNQHGIANARLAVGK
jgi:hypothetical protein